MYLPKGSTDLITLPMLRRRSLVQRMKTYTLARLKVNLEREELLVFLPFHVRKAEETRARLNICKTRQRQKGRLTISRIVCGMVAISSGWLEKEVYRFRQ